jgi:hypothetical protein
MADQLKLEQFAFKRLGAEELREWQVDGDREYWEVSHPQALVRIERNENGHVDFHVIEVRWEATPTFGLEDLIDLLRRAVAAGIFG